MASPAQTLANRRNAQASTGPRTPEGKSRSSGNALKHGLSTGFRVLQSENQDDFDDLIDELRRTFQPTNACESILVDEMAHSHWRLARARRLESLMVDSMLAASVCPDADTALLSALLNDRAGPFLVLQRYNAAAERTGYRALKQLLTLRRQEAQATRDAAVPNEANPDPPGDALPAAQPPPTQTNDSTGHAAPAAFLPPPPDTRRQPRSPHPSSTAPVHRPSGPAAYQGFASRPLG